MKRSDNKHYISAKESHNIAKENNRAIKELQKKRAAYKPEDYITEMRDPHNIVEFEDLHTYFYSDNGVVKAVNGVSFEIPEGSTVGVVGESGCGKSVTSLSLMQLVQAPSGQIVSGSIRFKSQTVVRDDRGRAVPLADSDENGKVKTVTGTEVIPGSIAIDETTEFNVESVSEQLEGWVWIPAFKRDKHGLAFELDGDGNALPVIETRKENGVTVPAFKAVAASAKKTEPADGSGTELPFAGKTEALPVFARTERGELVTVTRSDGTVSPVFETEGEGDKRRVVERGVVLTDSVLFPAVVGATDGKPVFGVEGGKLVERPLRSLMTVTKSEYGAVSQDGQAVSAVRKTTVSPVYKTDASGGRIFETESYVFDVAKMPQSDMTGIRGREIAMIFQEPMTSLNPVFTIGYQLDEVTLLHVDGATKEEAKKRSIEMLDLVGIAMPEHVYKSYPHQLSGGMRQRVMIAMALCCNPKLIIADEPTTALDVTIQAQILDLLRDVKKKISGSIMLITHDLGVIAEMVDYVVVMYAGRIVEKGTVDEIFNHPMHPYTVGLQKSKPIVGKEVDRLYSIPGNVPNPINMPSTCYFIDRCDRRCGKCRGEFPPMIQVSPTHSVACWLWNDEKQGGEAK